MYILGVEWSLDCLIRTPGLFRAISSSAAEEKSVGGKVSQREETLPQTFAGGNALHRGCNYVRSPPREH